MSKPAVFVFMLLALGLINCALADYDLEGGFVAKRMFLPPTMRLSRDRQRLQMYNANKKDHKRGFLTPYHIEEKSIRAAGPMHKRRFIMPAYLQKLQERARKREN